MSAHPAFLRHLSLSLLVLQNSAFALAMRYSRVMKDPDAVAYNTTVAVLVNELIKLVTSAILVLWEEKGFTGFSNVLWEQLTTKRIETIKTLVPAAIYTAQNNLTYIAASNLTAPTYQVLYQTKVVTTALFSVALLGKQLKIPQWVSIACLAVGAALVQFTPTRDTLVSAEQNPALGVACVMVASLMSGFSGVYLEKVLKQTSASLWVRNLQLSSFGVVLCVATIYVQSPGKLSDGTLLDGFNWIVWATVLLQSLGGLLTAVVVKYADNILKAFATAVAVVLSSVVSVPLFGFQVTLWFVCGSSLVLGAVFVYSNPDSINRMFVTTVRPEDQQYQPVMTEADAWSDSESDAERGVVMNDVAGAEPEGLVEPDDSSQD